MSKRNNNIEPDKYLTLISSLDMRRISESNYKLAMLVKRALEKMDIWWRD